MKILNPLAEMVGQTGFERMVTDFCLSPDY